MNAFLTVPEVAAEMGLSRQRIYDMVLREGLIPHVRHGRAIRIPASAWQEWLNTQHKAAMNSMNGEAAHVK